MLCGETRAQGRKEAIYMAEQLEKLAQYQRGLASGHINPHGDDSKGIGALAASVIRNLVAEYI
jgi:hypothetical protein